jgi:hypothetical protein
VSKGESHARTQQLCEKRSETEAERHRQRSNSRTHPVDGERRKEGGSQQGKRAKRAEDADTNGIALVAEKIQLAAKA